MNATTRSMTAKLACALAATFAVRAANAGDDDETVKDYRGALLAHARLMDARVGDDLTLISETEDGLYSLKIGLHSQFRYIWNFRQEPPDDSEVTNGFQARRNKLALSGNVADKDTKYKIVFAANRSGGDLKLEAAQITHKFGEGWSVKTGQDKLHLIRERKLSSKKQLAVDRSRLSSVFGQGYSQFVEIGNQQDRFRFFAAFSDGLSTANTDFTAPTEADFALTGRVEGRFGEAGWKQFDDFVGFAEDPFGVLVGAGVHYQSGGETGISTVDLDFTTVTADVSLEGDGFNAHVAGVWRQTDSTGGSPSFDDMGVLAQGGMFIDDQTEIFVRWDSIFPDDARDSDVDQLSTLTGGFNYYIIPDSHALVFTADAQYLFDPVPSSGSIVGPSTGINQLADDDSGQVVIRFQLEVVF